MRKTPLSVRLGNWLMDTKLPIPFKFTLGMWIKYRFTPDDWFEEF